MTEQERRERNKAFTPEETITFNLIDEYTVKRLQEEGDITLPQKKVNIPKDERWNTKQMNSKLLQGILNGDSVDKISKSIFPEIMKATDFTGKTQEEIYGKGGIIHKNEVSAMRAARTMVTGAENGGRLDSYKNLDSQGVVQKKVWRATADDRTRDSHLSINGEEQDIDVPFSNGLMFPGDSSGPGSEVWNCRCTMKDRIVGFRKADGSVSYVNYERDRTLHDDEIDRLKRRTAKRSTINNSAYNSAKRIANKQNLKHLPVDDLPKSLSDAQIVNKIAKEDHTGGSCASVAFSYCANKVGLDVTDFRGGKSRDFFAENYYKVFKSADAKIKTYKVKKEVSEVANIISKIKPNKQFILSAGKHMTIIKLTEQGEFYYLELQSDSNGWRKVGKNKEKIEEVLHERFRCRKTVGKDRNTKKPINRTVMLVDVDSFKDTDEFRDILGYMNTKK